jgi:hypothetical protein
MLETEDRKMKSALIIAALLLVTGAAHAYPRTAQEKLERYAHEVCRDLQLTSGNDAYERCYKEHMGYKDFCRDPDYGGCHDINGKTCYKLSNCCKNPHDWATEIRDKTICRQKRTK